MSGPASDVIDRFTRRLTNGKRDYEEMILAAYGKRRQASLESMLASQYALNLTVQWEVFINDLLVAYVAVDPDTFMRSLRSKVEQSVKDRYGAEVLKSMTLDFPEEIRLAKVPAWLDPKEFNVTVKSAEGLSQRANAILAAPYARKFTLAADDAAVVDFSIALRNYLAHNSTASRTVLLANYSALAGANADLVVPVVRDVGTYLKSRTVGGAMRVCVLASRLSAVANALAP